MRLRGKKCFEAGLLDRAARDLFLEACKVGLTRGHGPS
jgi:hypothetical protein